MVLTVLVTIFYIVVLVSLALDGLWAVFLLLGVFYLCVVLWFITFGRIYIRRAKRRGVNVILFVMLEALLAVISCLTIFERPKIGVCLRGRPKKGGRVRGVTILLVGRLRAQKGIAMQLAPSKKPKKESKLFTVLGILCFALSLAAWFAAVAGLAFSARGAILSHRTKNWTLLVMAVIGGAVNAVVIFIDRG